MDSIEGSADDHDVTGRGTGDKRSGMMDDHSLVSDEEECRTEMSTSCETPTSAAPAPAPALRSAVVAKSARSARGIKRDTITNTPRDGVDRSPLSFDVTDEEEGQEEEDESGDGIMDSSSTGNGKGRDSVAINKDGQIPPQQPLEERPQQADEVYNSDIHSSDGDSIQGNGEDGKGNDDDGDDDDYVDDDDRDDAEEEEEGNDDNDSAEEEDGAGSAGFGRKLISCSPCHEKGFMPHECLARRSETGATHAPRLQVVRGNTYKMLKDCMALLLPSNRDKAHSTTEDGAVEGLPLTAANLELRFMMPCSLCLSLGTCTLQDHPTQVKSLAELVPRPVVAPRPSTIITAPTATKRRVVVLEQGRYEIPTAMTVLKDGFMSLGFSVGDVVISSERRPDVPGDFAINHHMKMSTTGTSRFSTVKIDTVEGALRLRALRDLLGWRYGSNWRVHPVVAARVLHIWAMANPQQGARLSELTDRKFDKVLGFRVNNQDVPSSSFTVSELRGLHDRRVEELKNLFDSFTTEQIHAGEPLTYLGPAKRSLSSRAPDNVSAGDESGKITRASGPSGGVEGGGAGRGRVDGGITTDHAASGAADDPRSFHGRVGSSSSSSASPVPSDHGALKKSRRVQASDGKWYTLPKNIRRREERLLLALTLDRYKIDGKTIVEDGMTYSPIQKNFYRARITRENLLALRAMRDVLHRSKVLHPLMAAAAFEVWENLHKDDPSKPDDTLVTVTGLELPDGSIPEAKFNTTDLRGLRGSAMVAEIERVFKVLRHSRSVLSGVLESESGDFSHGATGGGGGSAGSTGWQPRGSAEGSAYDSRGSPDRGRRIGNGRAESEYVTRSSDHARDRVFRSSDPSLFDERSGEYSANAWRGGYEWDVSYRRRKFASSPERGEASFSGEERVSLLSLKRKRPSGNGSIEDTNVPPKRLAKAGSDTGRAASQRRGLENGRYDEREDASDAAARSLSWLRAVEANNEELDREEERLRQEETKAKGVHVARNMELMKWIVDEQSGKHNGVGDEGPPPMT